MKRAIESPEQTFALPQIQIYLYSPLCQPFLTIECGILLCLWRIEIFILNSLVPMRCADWERGIKRCLDGTVSI